MKLLEFSSNFPKCNSAQKQIVVDQITMSYAVKKKEAIVILICFSEKVFSRWLIDYFWVHSVKPLHFSLILVCHYRNHLQSVTLTKIVLLTLGALTIAASSFGSKQLEMIQPLERKSCLGCKPISSSKEISGNYDSMKRSILDGAHPIGINRTYNSMRKTMLDGVNLESNMTEAVACKLKRYNAHKPLQVCP